MTATVASMSLKLPAGLKDRLKTLAHIKKRPAHAIAREAVEVYISREEEQERHNREADAAWRHYQETGLHVTGEEVMQWVASWGTDNELPPPTCHG